MFSNLLENSLMRFPSFVSQNPQTPLSYHTYLSLQNTLQYSTLSYLSFSFSLQQFHTNTVHTHAHKHTQTSQAGFRCGHKSSQWVAMIPPTPAEPGGEKWGLGSGTQGWWAGEGAAAKWLPSVSVSIKARTRDCSASGCDTSQTANISDTNTRNGVNNHF